MDCVDGQTIVAVETIVVAVIASAADVTPADANENA